MSAAPRAANVNAMPTNDEWAAIFSELLAQHTATLEFPYGKPDDVGDPIAVTEPTLYRRLVERGMTPQWAGRRIEQVLRNPDGPLVRVHTQADRIKSVVGYVGDLPPIWIARSGLTYTAQGEPNSGVADPLPLIMLRETFARLLQESA